MEFVLVDDSVINAYTDRVSRIVEGVGQLQGKMATISEKMFRPEMPNQEPMQTNYQEPVQDVYQEPVQDVYQEPVQDVQDVQDVYQEPMQVNDNTMESSPNHIQDDVMDSAMDDIMNEAMDDIDMGDIDLGNEYEPTQPTAQSSDDDFDIDLDAVLNGISFDTDMQI